MAKVWIQAVEAFSMPDASGKLVRVEVGDCVQVGKHFARDKLASGAARVPGGDETRARKVIAGDIQDCGVLVRGNKREAARIVGKYKLQVASGRVSLPFARTLVWRPGLALNPRQVVMGFARLEEQDGYDAWEGAAMLRAGEKMALHIGTADERRATRDTIGTLKVPLYEAGAVWVRRTAATERFAAAWAGWLKEGISEEHALLRALYVNPLLLCTLPALWLSSWWVKESR